MNWAEKVKGILEVDLFQVGEQVIRPTDLLFFLLALVITLVVARWIRVVLQRYFLRRLPVEAGAQYAVARLTQYALWVVGFLVALKLLHINLTAFAVVAGALGVGIGFGLQNTVANFVAGLVLLFERPIRIHDRISMEEVEGNVRAINFRATTILTNDNISVIVPNSQFINTKVINWSHSDPRVRIHLPVGVAYGSDVERVTRTLLEVAEQTEGVLKKPDPTVWFTEFGNSSLNFELLVWTDEPIYHRVLRSRLNYAIDAAFRRNGIQIPFPQHDLHIKSASALKEVFSAASKPEGQRVHLPEVKP